MSPLDPERPDHITGIDEETADLLRSLVDDLKPQVIVECGAYPGLSTKALREMKPRRAKLRSYESDPELREKVKALPSPPDFSDADLSLIDCDVAERRKHLQLWLDDAPRGAVAVVDDAGDRLTWLEFRYSDSTYVPTPRGAMVVRK